MRTTRSSPWLWLLGAAVAAITIGGCTSDEPSWRDDWQSVIDPRLRYNEEPLPPEKNAYTIRSRYKQTLMDDTLS